MELLVALALLAVFVTVFWRFFITTTRVQVHQSEYMQSMAEVLRVWHVLREDLVTARDEGDDLPVILNEQILASLGLEHIRVQDFPKYGRLIEFLLAKGRWEPAQSPLDASAPRYPDLRSEHEIILYTKTWYPCPAPVWPHSGWPKTFHRADDDLPPQKVVDAGQRFDWVLPLENVVERVYTAPVVPGKDETIPTVVCIRRHTGTTVYAFLPYDKELKPVRRLYRYSPEDGTVLLSEGLIDAFAVVPTLEFTPHPQDPYRSMDVQKLFFRVHVSAVGQADGRAIAPRPYALETIVFPVHVNQRMYSRWIPARN